MNEAVFTTHTQRKNNKFSGWSISMGLSLDSETYETIDQYAKLLGISKAKLVVDSLPLETFKKAIKAQQEHVPGR